MRIALPLAVLLASGCALTEAKREHGERMYRAGVIDGREQARDEACQARQLAWEQEMERAITTGAPEFTAPPAENGEGG